MQRRLERLADAEYDLLIIGGGITGAFVAHDAILRGLRVALVEKNDFGAYTSSASSKLLHGGIRYLPKGQVWKVRESYRETAIFQHIAPHLTRWLPFLVPTEAGSLMKGKEAMHLAMLLYGLCGSGLDRLIIDAGKRPPARRFLDPDAARQSAALLAALPRLTGAQVLWESHMHSSERMTLAVLKTAARGGAEVANYVAVRGLLGEGDRVIGVQAEDRLSGAVFDIRARLVVNAAGPYVQGINESMPQLRLGQRLTGFSKGVHLVTRQLEPEYALALTTQKKIEALVSRGGRHFFIIPWRGCSLIGTTNVPFDGRLDEVRVTARDIDDFLADINAALPEARLSREDVRYSFCGIYPLIASNVRADTYQGTGEYQVIDHARTNGVEGVITALGAKYTTARFVAEQAVDLALGKLGRSGTPCCTVQCRLAEGEIDDIRAFRGECRRLFAGELAADLVDTLVSNHGCEAQTLIARGRECGLLQPTVAGRETLDIEIDHAVRHEMALSLDDLLFRRTGLGTVGHPGAEALARCTVLMGDLLGWNETERSRQIESVAARYTYI